MESNSLQKYHDLFIVGTTLILNTIIENTNENMMVYKNAKIFYRALDEKQFDMSKMVEMIKKVFSVLSKNIEYVRNNDPNLFMIRENRDNRQVKVTILPGLDISEAYKYLDNKQKLNLWRYIHIIFCSSIKMICMVNESTDNHMIEFCNEIENQIPSKSIYEEFYKKNPNSNLYKKEDTFNPYLGVGENSKEYGTDQLLSGTDDIKERSAGLGAMTELLGIDKMFNLDELKDKLKNVNPDDINEASDNIKKLLGDNMDEGTSELISNMLVNITDELKNDNILEGNLSMNSIFSIAENVAKNMTSKIDPNKMDMEKIWQSTQNLAKKFGGDKGGVNPLSILTEMMEKQQNRNNNNQQLNPQDMMKDYQQMMKKMGLPDLNKMMNNSTISPVSSLTSDTRTNTKANTKTRVKPKPRKR